MIAKFREVDKAVSYLCEGLYALFEHERAAVFYCGDGMREERHRFTQVNRLAPSLLEMCKRFPEATAVYLPDEGVLPLGAIQCRCHSHIQKACPQHCQHRHERPVVAVLVCPEEHHVTDNELHSALELVHFKIREHSKAERMKSLHNNHNHHRGHHSHHRSSSERNRFTPVG